MHNMLFRLRPLLIKYDLTNIFTERPDLTYPSTFPQDMSLCKKINIKIKFGNNVEFEIKTLWQDRPM